MREQTAQYILGSWKSVTSVTEEFGIDKNAVWQWVRNYRRAHSMLSYAEAKGIVKKEPKREGKLMYRIKEQENELKKRERISG